MVLSFFLSFIIQYRITYRGSKRRREVLLMQTQLSGLQSKVHQWAPWYSKTWCKCKNQAIDFCLSIQLKIYTMQYIGDKYINLLQIYIFYYNVNFFIFFYLFFFFFYSLGANFEPRVHHSNYTSTPNKKNYSPVLHDLV
jgi:hypothetical protein